MAVVTATEARRRFGQMLVVLKAEPVHIQNGRNVAVVLSPL
ncbi:PHD/YefM family antitoxin component YafN of YafNO toxin-antitoxin module [Devosia sp. 2618]